MESHADALRRGLTAGALLAGLTLVAISIVVLIWLASRDRIAANERGVLTRTLTTLVPADRFDNDPLTDRIELRPAALDGAEPIVVYRARRGKTPVAAFATSVARDGYAGPIRLLVALYPDGRVAGVRVLAHQETPGLGDAIDERRSPWILSFTGTRLGAPPRSQWAVRKDGGVFDQFTGATVTPRAVVRAVYNLLEYFDRYPGAIFGQSPTRADDG
jgi:electron transport complex protein RnfG